MSYTFLFKYVIIGDSGVGKSCILLQFTDKRFRSVHDFTIGVEFGVRMLKIGENRIKLHIRDTAGQEAFRSITRSPEALPCRDAICLLLVYDTTQRDTFNHVSRWLEEARANANSNMAVVLIGNKCDLLHRQVTYEEGARFACDHGLTFWEISAKTSENVEDVFAQTATKFCVDIQNGTLDPASTNSAVKLGESAYQPLPAAILTLHAEQDCDEDYVHIKCVSLAGEVTAELDIADNASWQDLHIAVAQKLRHGFRLVTQGGVLVHRDADKSVIQFLVGRSSGGHAACDCHGNSKENVDASDNEDAKCYKKTATTC